MKIKSLFMAFLAGALTLVACKKEQNPNDLPPSITVTPGSVEFDQSEGSKKLEVNATRAWTVSGIPDWVAITPASGAASVKAAEVVISVLANSGNDREATLTFSIGLAKQAVTVKQKGAKGEIDNGKGTKESPYSVAGVIAYLNTLGADVNSPEKVYVKGQISKIADNGAYSQSGTYGNATFYISDGDPAGGEFYCYRILYLGNKKYTSGTDIKVGDEVIIYGNVVNYKGNTPETQQNSAFLYSLNGVTEGGDGPATGGDPKGSGTKEDPYNVAAAINAVKNLTWTANDNYQKVGPYYVKGKISRIADNGTFSQSGTFGNATFYISDDGTQNGEFYCYRLLYLGNKKYTSGTDIKVGDEVVIYGELMNYRGNTPETVSNSAHLYSLNGVTGGDDPGPGPDPGTASGSGTQADPYNVAAALNAVKGLTWTANDNYEKVGPYYVKGKISRIADKGAFAQSGDYGNATFYISDDGSQNNEFYCYRILYLGNKKYTSGTDIKVGDEVVIYSELMNYRGDTPETVANAGYLYSLNGSTGGDTPGPGPDPGTASGSGTQSDPYNVAAALNAVKGLTWTANDNYEKVGPYYVKGKISRIADKGAFAQSGDYGNASFYISDDGSENNEFYCFRILYFNSEKYTSGTDIKVGDEVIIYGELMNYKGNTPETVSGKACLYSLNGSTGGDTPGPGPGPDPGTASGSGTQADPYNVAAALNAVKDLTWTANDNYEKVGPYYVKGKISRIPDNGAYSQSGTYGNASFYISDDGSQNNEFYCFRILYFGSEKYTSGTDIKVGDQVVIYGELMNYRGDTPETVSGKACLYSLNGSTGGDTPGGGPGEGETVTFTYDNAEGIPVTTNGEACSTTLGAITVQMEAGARNEKNQDIRIYKGKKMTISTTAGNITKIVITSKGGDNGADKFGEGAPAGYSASATSGTWTGSSTSVAFTASGAQVRMLSIEVTYE